MLSISRQVVRAFRTVVRKASGSGGRLMDAPISFRNDGDGVRLQFRSEQQTIEYRLANAQTDAFSLPFSALADFEGGKDHPVVLRLDGDTVIAEWSEAGVPQSCRYVALKGDDVGFDDPPLTPVNNPRLFVSLVEVMQCVSPDAGRFAVHCVQLRGQKGEAVGTDGRQLLIVRGLEFPWTEDVLLRRTGLFACREFTGAGAAALGLSADYCVVRVGPWTARLLRQKDLRYPNVDQVLPASDTGATELVLASADAAFLIRSLPHFAVSESDQDPVTLHLNGQVVVRAKAASGQISELILSRSHARGDEIRIRTNRIYLQRAAQLGLLRLHVRNSPSPIVASDDTRLYAWQPLDCKTALGPCADAIRIESCPPLAAPPVLTPVERTPIPMSSSLTKPPERSVDTVAAKTDEVGPDPLQEAEAIKTQLRDLLGRVGDLVATIRRQRRQAHLVGTTRASPKQLHVVPR